MRHRLGLIGRVFFGLSLCAFGILQFVYGDFVPGRAPAWPAGVPGRLVWAWVSGALTIAGSRGGQYDGPERPN
jgi:uncharacterized membrane protein YphA (DoxX/SURF4 family)